MAQFDENCQAYRCCCDCCHLKTATSILGWVELVFLAYFLINSLVLVDKSGRLPHETSGFDTPLVMVPFGVCLCGVAIGLLFVILMLVGVCIKSAHFLLPHFVLQLICIPIFLGLIVLASLAVNTEKTSLYRLLNAGAFEAAPDSDTVDLNAYECFPVVLALIVFCFLFVLEIWFSVIVWRCYKYLLDKRDYIRYCQHYSLPLKTVGNRHGIEVPQYSPR